MCVRENLAALAASTLLTLPMAASAAVVTFGFDTTVTQQMQRFSGMLDLQMFNAILGAGQDTAKDTATTPSCESPDALDFARFGVDMVKDSGEMLATIPADYHLAIAN